MGTAFESAHTVQGPTVSVVVVSHNTPRTLEKCLASLSRQPALEILVVDCSDRDPGVSLRAQFPGVAFRHFAKKLSIPRMRREGILASNGEIVALTEGWMEPCPGWVESLREAHRQFSDVPVVGGAIAFPCEGSLASRLEWADYFTEYGEYSPAPGDDRKVVPAETISGANCSYKRWAIEECRELVDQAAWEPRIHQRLQERGHELRRAAAAVVCYQKPARPGELLRQRFSYGRGHGAERARAKSWVKRLGRIVASPLVPWVLLWRLWLALPRVPGLRTRFLAAAGWMLALNTAWAAGEAAGIWVGPARRAPVIR